jgi:hypothetical protein
LDLKGLPRNLEESEASGEKLHPTKPMLCHQGGTRIGMLVLLTALLFGCGDEPPATAPPPPPELTPTRVLFIGNSLTFTNDVPGLVTAIGHAVGAAVTTQAVIGGGFALEDHWPNQSLHRLILDGDWDYVVLQQGPSALPESRANLIHWTRQFDTEIRQGGARTALYMVWPDIHRMSAFDSVSVSYRAAAEAVDGVLLPAGDAWTEAWRRDPGLRLFGPDGFHPSVAGSYLAALTIFSGLTGRSARDVPLRPAEIGLLHDLTDHELEVLREAAATTVGVVPQPAAR